MKAVDEPAYLTVGTDVSAKYRGAFCEAKIKTVKRLVKVKVTLKPDNSTQLVQDDQVKGPLRVGATVEMKTTDGSPQEAIISKLTDASWYTVVFDDGDEKTLRRTSLCLKGERHFAESETLDQLPLTNPEHFGTPVIGKKTNRGRRSSLPMTEDEKEESSEEEDEDLKRLNDELLGKIVSVKCSSSKEWFTALVVSPSCSDDTAVKKDQCLVRSLVDSKFHSVARKDLTELDVDVLKSEHCGKQGVQDAIAFLTSRIIPEKWKMDMSEILESSSSDEEAGEEDASDSDQNKEEEEETQLEEEADPAERDNFLQQLYKFMEDRGTPINKPPVLGYKDLNLFNLFRLVYQQGGCDNIESGAVWKQIYMDLGIPILNSAASYNVKTAYKKYLYGFEEYCRSASIQFRTIHHNDPIPVKEIQVEEEEPMESSEKKEPASPLYDAKMNEEDESDSSGEYEKEETEIISPRGRRRCAFNAFSVETDVEDSDKIKDNNKENKDIEEDLNKTEENESTPVRRSLQCQTKEDQKTKQDESERESDEDDEKPCEGKEDSEHKGGTEEENEDTKEQDFLAGTKVKVKYGRGKTQKIYEANIKSTEVDGGEILYLVHYYGWNVRYDEWVKADRIIWPSDKGGLKKKQKKMTKNKDENDENKEDDKRSKRGRPPLKSSLQTNMTCGLPKSPTSEGKSSSKSMRNSLSDSSSLSNGLEGSARRRTRRSSGLYDSDRFSNDSSTSESESDETSEKASVKEEDEALPAEEPENIFSRVEISPVKEEPPVICVSKDPEHGPTKPAETLNQEVDESEQIVPIYGKQTEPLEEIKEAEHLPNSKGRRSKTKDPSLEDTECLSATQEDTMAEPHVEEETLDLPSLSPLQSKELPIPQREAELPADQLAQEKKGMKRKALEPSSPDKKLRADCDPELPIIVAQEKPAENNEAQERSNAVDEEEELPNVNEEMPSLTAELEHVQSTRTDELDVPLNEITNVPYREEQDTMMPTIGPENLLCHEVDLGDFDEKDKVEELVMDKVELDAQTILPPTQPHNYSVASPLALSHDESHSIKSESDITIEVDSVAEESQECLCESESANGFEASTTSSNCSVTAQEAEMPEKGHKRMNEGLSGTLAKKQKRTPKRISASSKAEKNGIGQSSDSEDLSTLDSSKCTPIKHPGVPKTHKIIRSPARITSPHNKDGEKEKHREKHHPHTSPRAYKWTLQLSELDNMSGTEKIVFLQEKLQEMRKYYMSLKSEVATIDRRRKRLKKKDREVSNTGASMSSGSSETGMSPSSASPPQNTVALECR